jgi:PRC-barrel domain
MLRSLKSYEGYKVAATDGELGHVVNVLFDDERWTVRYLVVDTAGFFTEERDVLLSPITFGHTDWATRLFHVKLTKDKVWRSPSLDTDLPVSRVRESEFAQYYGYPSYWDVAGITGPGAEPSMLPSQQWKDVAGPRPHAGDRHLRSAREVRGYRLQGTDTAVGHIEDFIVDDETWELRYLAIDTSDWWFGKRVLIAPWWATAISWDDRSVSVELTREQVKAAPTWSPEAPINREYEARLYDFYGRPSYWAPPLSGMPTPPSPTQPH